MKKKTKHIAFIVISILILFWTYRYLTVNGRVIPIKISKVFPHPQKENYQVFNFKEYIIELPIGWKDKGFRSEALGWSGKLKKNNTIFHYGYGSCSSRAIEPLQNFLYQQRNDVMIMGDTVIVGRTDSTISLRFVWPIDPRTSDTLKTGVLTDSLIKRHPLPNQLYYDCNFYAITVYNDSIYLIPIEVPEIILNSVISDTIIDDHRFNIIRHEKTGIGITQVNVERAPYSNFTIWSQNLDYIEQEELIEAGLSVRFKEYEYKFKQGKY
jgi:hypothetical protein